MNFLELAQKLRQECVIAGVGPSSVVSQTGQAKMLVDWINDAWVEIQGRHDDWNFMREDFSFETSASNTSGDYTVAGGAGVGAGLTDHRYWHNETLRAYTTSLGVSDEQFLVMWDYSSFRDTYRFGQRQFDRPCVFAVKPNGKELMFGPIPNGAYTVTGEYQRIPTRMAVDTDEPDLPEHLHLVIVYKAMQFYALEQGASEVMSRGQIGEKSLMAQLEREQLPSIGLGAAMA